MNLYKRKKIVLELKRIELKREYKRNLKEKRENI